MRTTPAAFVRQQQQQPNIQQNAYLNNINISSTEIGSSRTPSSMIPNGEGFTHQPNVLDHNTTVREVITRQIKNNRVKNLHCKNFIFSMIYLLLLVKSKLSTRIFKFRRNGFNNSTI